MSPSSSITLYQWCVYSDDCFSLSYWVDFFFSFLFLFSLSFFLSLSFFYLHQVFTGQLQCMGFFALQHVASYSQTECWIHVTCIGRWILNLWAPGKSRVGYFSMWTRWSSDGKWQESWKMTPTVRACQTLLPALKKTPSLFSGLSQPAEQGDPVFLHSFCFTLWSRRIWANILFSLEIYRSLTSRHLPVSTDDAALPRREKTLD